jgi:hypothetical protein
MKTVPADAARVLMALSVEHAADAVLWLDASARIVYANAAACRSFGYALDDLTAMTVFDLETAMEPAEWAARWAALEAGGCVSAGARYRAKDGREIPVQITAHFISHDGHRYACAFAHDITEQERLEAQLHRAQRLESIGRLAGAVAHDFNNLLTVINGYSEIALGQIDPRDPLHEPLREIKAAGDRAAGLTQQLLAFSRRQVLQMKVLDVNAVLGDLEPMLRRLIGEDVDLTLACDPALAMVKADPVQMQQVVMNLAVNARDAMPHGGQLVIETANVELDHEATRQLPDSHPGRYVLLAVTDNGCGMDEATLNRLFEPLFTTKAPGKGTGLGLSTVYGVVRQSGGFIGVYSEIGHGTSFKIYLPRTAEGEAGESPAGEASPAATVGTETILLVEDQPEVRHVARRVLTMHGYRVLSAGDGASALEIATTEPGPIDLVLTDVVMPGMNGAELAVAIRPVRPDAKVILMSGYADTAAAQRDQVPEGAEFLQKPFTPDGLARKVRQVLDRRHPVGRILVVDDEVEIRRLLCQFLVGAGYEVSESSDGRQAVAEVDAGGVALVITDLVMPEQEGIETIREMRRRHPAVKIVAMSGAFGGRFLRTAEMLGAHATLLKPVSADTLVRTVRAVLGR